MKKSFLVTGNFPVYEIQGNYTRPGLYDQSHKPSFIVFGQIHYEKFYCSLRFKRQQSDYLFEKDVPEFEIRLDIASLSILESLIHETLHNSTSITGPDGFVKLCNTTSANTQAENQRCSFINAIPEMLTFNIFNPGTNSYEQFRIMGYFQVLSFSKFIENIKQLYLNSYSSWELWKNFQSDPVPPLKSNNSVPPPGIINTRSDTGTQTRNEFNTAPVSSDAVAPNTTNAPNKPGMDVPAVPGIPEIPQDI